MGVYGYTIVDDMILRMDRGVEFVDFFQLVLNVMGNLGDFGVCKSQLLQLEVDFVQIFLDVSGSVSGSLLGFL